MEWHDLLIRVMMYTFCCCFQKSKTWPLTRPFTHVCPNLKIITVEQKVNYYQYVLGINNIFFLIHVPISCCLQSFCDQCPRGGAGECNPDLLPNGACVLVLSGLLLYSGWIDEQVLYKGVLLSNVSSKQTRYPFIDLCVIGLIYIKKKIKVKLKKIELNFSSFLSCTQWLLDNQEKLVKDFVVLKFNVDKNIFCFVLHLSTSHLWSTWPATLMQSCWTFAITRWRCRHLVPSSSARASRMFFWFRASFRKPPGGFQRAK